MFVIPNPRRLRVRDLLSAKKGKGKADSSPRQKPNGVRNDIFSLFPHPARSLHLDFHAHPGMNAALKTMFTFQEIRNVDIATLKDSSLGDCDVRKAAGAFGDSVLSWRIEPWYEAAELCDLGEGVRLAAWSTTLRVVPSLIWSVSGSKSQPGSGCPAAALANKSANVVNAPSVTFLQKSGPMATLKVAGSHSSKATIYASRGDCACAGFSCARACVAPANIKTPSSHFLRLIILYSLLFYL